MRVFPDPDGGVFGIAVSARTTLKVVQPVAVERKGCKLLSEDDL